MDEGRDLAPRHPAAAPAGEPAGEPAGAVVPAAPAQQADSDRTLVRLWLHGRSPNTTRAYSADIAEFLAHAGKPLRAVAVGDVQAFADSLARLAPASRARKVGAVKSLVAFGHRVGFLPFDVGAPVRLAPIKNVLAERILEEGAVHPKRRHGSAAGGGAARRRSRRKEARPP